MGCVYVLVFLAECGFILIKYIAKCHALCLRIGAFRNALIQIHANFLKNQFLPNIVHAKYIYNKLPVCK